MFATHHVLRPASALFVCAVLCVLAPTTQSSAAELCVPQAFGVPGHSGPPEWASGSDVMTRLDDPRWVGSTSQAFPKDGSSSHARARALFKNNTLYLSFQVLVDANGAVSGQQDSVYLALANDLTSVARLVRIRVQAAADGEALGSGNYAIEYYTAPNATSAWSAAVPDAAAAAMTEDVAVWRNSGDQSWAVNLKVNLADAALGLTSPIKMWSGTVLQLTSTPPTFTTYAWPLGTVGAVNASGTTAPAAPGAIIASDWGDVTLGGDTCGTGVSLDSWQQVGVKSGSSLVHTISSVSDNTFAAYPTYNGVSTAADKVKARFRIANWGSAIQWTDIPGAEAVGSLADGRIEWPCSQTSAPNCPTLSATQPKHQCMLVELSSDQPVTFLKDSVYRNMEFVGGSYFERDAEISIKGLPPLPNSAGKRDVYLYLKTRNMPEKARGPLDPKRLAAALAAAAATHHPIKQRRRIESSKTDHELIAGVWPTYEVHVYYDTGTARLFGDQALAKLQPGLPFGYFVDHQGALEGWLYDLVGAGAELEEIAPGFFKVQVPDDGAIKVTTRIEALEPGRPSTLGTLQNARPTTGCPECPPVTTPPTKRTCACYVVGYDEGNAGWLAFGLVAVVIVRRRCRNRRERARNPVRARD